MEGILKGVKVIGLEGQVAGPTATMMLADMGAEVIKVERPGTGDTSREGAPWIVNEETGAKESGYFSRFNRTKQSLTLNTKTDAGKEILWKLIDEADIVVENLAPGAMDKVGFTWEAIHARNPKLVYVAISGFGRCPGGKYDGPYGKRTAFDIIVQAMAGQMYTCGNDADGAPTWLGFAVGDSGTGVYAAYAALLGYINVLRNGVGEFMDVSMYDCMVALAERSHNIYANTGSVTSRGPDKIFCPWGGFKCKDGYVALIVPMEKMWKKFCAAIGREDLCDAEKNPELQSGPGRAKHLEDIIRPEIDKFLADKTMEEATNLFLEQGLPCGPIQSSKEVAADPHTAARKMIVDIYDPVIERNIKMVGCPIKMPEHEPVYGAFPALGGDTEAILKKLGYTDANIAAFREDGSI
jgi:crotonobetainyl-CoA:carnitine CoA-transferase CaiB-like acyl-CoA transferase